MRHEEIKNKYRSFIRHTHMDTQPAVCQKEKEKEKKNMARI